MRIEKNKKTDYLIVLSSLIIITAIMYYLENNKIAYYFIYRYLYLFPIIYAAYKWGLNGGFYTSLIANSLYIPILISIIDKEGKISYFSSQILLSSILFTSLGILLGNLLENEEEEERKFENLFTLQKSLLYNLDEREVLNNILETIKHINYVEKVFLYYPQNCQKKIITPFPISSSEENLLREIEEYLQDVRTPLLLNQIEDQEFPEFKSLLAYSFFLGRERAILILINKDGNNFSAEDLTRIHYISEQINLIMEKHLLFEKIKNEKDYLQKILENIPAAVLTTDINKNITFYNSFLTKLLGIDRKEISGNFLKVMPQELKEPLKVGEEKSLTYKTIIYQEKEYSRKDEEKLLIGIWAGLIKSIKEEIIGTIFLLSDLKEKKELLTLEEINHLKSEFISTISHELRIPLTSIKGFISTITSDEENYFSLKEIKEFQQIIWEETNRLESLLNNLLNTANITTGRILKINRELFNLKDEISYVIKIKKTFYRDNVFELIFYPEEKWIETDKSKLCQILYNLIDNAAKYSKKRGKITITVEEYMEQKEEYFKFCVQDEGIGIPPDKIEFLFEKFGNIETPSSREKKGVGLGLYICKNLVEQLGGKIWVKSKEGVGSQFYFILPKKTQDRIQKNASLLLQRKDDI